jgi:hypothetical protein
LKLTKKKSFKCDLALRKVSISLLPTVHEKETEADYLLGEGSVFGNSVEFTKLFFVFENLIFGK